MLDRRGVPDNIGYSKNIPQDRKRTKKGNSTRKEWKKELIAKRVSRAQRMRKSSRGKNLQRDKSNQIYYYSDKVQTVSRHIWVGVSLLKAFSAYMRK